MHRRATIAPTPSACMPVATRCSRCQVVLLLLIHTAIPATRTARPSSEDRRLSSEAAGAGTTAAGTVAGAIEWTQAAVQHGFLSSYNRAKKVFAYRQRWRG